MRLQLRQQRTVQRRSVRRRVLTSGLAAVMIGIVATAGLRHWWLPEYRPGLQPGERYGIDVSSHQGEIDWNRVAGDGIDFAYLKATEGGDFVDERFATNWDGATAAGIDRGAYHFFTLCTSGDIQADNFLAVLPDDADGLAPAIDLELDGNCSKRPDNETVQQELAEFITAVESGTDKPVVLYVGDDFEERYPARQQLDRPLWRRRLLRRPGEDDWALWQVMASAHVAGIGGKVDLDVMGPDAPVGSR